MEFFVGLHHPSDAHRFGRCMVSANVLCRRTGDFAVNDWIMDSGAFTQVAKQGGYAHEPAEYADQIGRWSRCGQLLAAVSQDWMCGPFVLAKTGKSIAEHQALTIERYDRLRQLSSAYVMPVIQGYQPEEYARHVRAYGPLLAHGAWVGVGSVCKRNARPEAIVAVLEAILAERPDLRLHGFGIKLTALADPRVRGLLATADSMAWSFAARREGRDANSRHEAAAYVAKVEALLLGPGQPLLWNA